ncbi:MAG: hypothetical protein KME19_21490 [Microcoleus vaginatus WJT46-NPBG5]|nr:hypothetical protein [Microcoleus vaginatus WJT46-NPBG5]
MDILPKLQIDLGGRLIKVTEFISLVAEGLDSLVELGFRELGLQELGS